MRPTIDTGSAMSEAEYLQLAGLDASEETLLARAGVPPRFLHAEHERAAEVGGALLEGRNAYVFGPVGTHKTTLACAALRHVVRSGVRCRFVPTRMLAERLRDSFRDGTDPIADCRRVPVLVLDDLGKETARDWCLERIFALVDHRHNEGLPTLTTTQYPGGRLVERLARDGDTETARSIISRLKAKSEAGCCLQVETEGPDGRIA